MLRKCCFLGLALVGAGCLSGCDKNSSAQPTCYSGVVLRDRCWDGILLQVDRQFPIGTSISSLTGPDSLGNTNVIAAVNSLGTLGVRGQRISFTFTNDPAQQAPLRACTHDQIPLPIPHLVLANISATPCAQPW
ncbi:hypothetical protein [Hymenobacter sp. UYCo722]|uniref:hypothetical protein n=1 Tax=Hymenobacter sp. UYCo722 TaxID=3156335 RepID=UPI003395A315